MIGPAGGAQAVMLLIAAECLMGLGPVDPVNMPAIKPVAMQFALDLLDLGARHPTKVFVPRHIAVMVMAVHRPHRVGHSQGCGLGLRHGGPAWFSAPVGAVGAAGSAAVLGLAAAAGFPAAPVLLVCA